MTRELKLALIVGFSLVLVVTVLISDHLSRANKTKLAEPSANAPGIVDPVPAERRSAPSTITPGPLAVVEPSPVNASGPGTLGGSNPVTTPDTLVQGRGGSTPSRDEHPDYRDVIRGDVHLPPAAKTEIVPTTTPTGPARTSPVDFPASADKSYTVASGDNMFGITKKFYGDGKYWKKLAQYNSPRVGADGEVKEGMQLKIPAKETILGKAGKTTPTAAISTVGFEKPAAPTASGHAAASTYTVKPGDTLGEIARKTLHSAKRAHEIVEMNKDVIKDVDTIPEGAVLKIPAA